MFASEYVHPLVFPYVTNRETLKDCYEFYIGSFNDNYQQSQVLIDLDGSKERVT